MSRYIWYKNGKEFKRTLDPEGKFITKKITGHNTYVEYSYLNYYSLYSKAYYKNGLSHREGGKPAWIRYNEDGSVKVEAYYKDGEYHRDGDKPAYIHYGYDGVEYEEYYKNGVEYKPTTKV